MEVLLERPSVTPNDVVKTAKPLSLRQETRAHLRGEDVPKTISR